MMREFTQLLLLLLLLPSLTIAQTKAVTKTRPLVLTHVTVIDGTGSAPKSGMTVLITDERITEIGRSGSVRIPRGAQVFNATGKFLIPGLWDMHVHLSWTKATALPVLIVNGVTSVRDLGGRLSELDEGVQKLPPDS